MSKNEFSFGEEFDLGNNFKVAVGDRVPLTSLKKAVEACQGRHNVRLFTADAPHKEGSGDWNPMRVNIHLDAQRKVSRINFG